MRIFALKSYAYSVSRALLAFGAEKEGHDDVTPRLDLPVRLYDNTVAEVIHDERLMRLSQTELPGEASALDAAPLRRTGATIVARDKNVVGLGLGDAGSNDPHADFRHKLDRDARTAVGSLEVVDELSEIFDRVNVVVRRGRDEANAYKSAAPASVFAPFYQ